MAIASTTPAMSSGWALRPSGVLRAEASFAFHEEVDTRALRGGPAFRLHDFYTAELSGHTDSGRRVSAFLGGDWAWSIDDDSGEGGRYTDCSASRPAVRRTTIRFRNRVPVR